MNDGMEIDMLELIKNAKRLSFKLNGESFSPDNAKTTITIDGNCIKTVYDLGGGLQLTNTLTLYPEHYACDWVNEWKHTGDEPSALISELWDCDIMLPIPPCTPKITGPAYLPQSENVIKVYSPRGSEWSDKEFFCDVDKLVHNQFENWLSEGSRRTYASTGGRSSDSRYAPFFNIKHGEKELGFIVAIGWTGQWNAEIARAEDKILFKSKIEDTCFRMLPGECFRTSSVTLMQYEGTVHESQNKWRRFLKEIYSPMGKRQVPQTAPFCAGLWGGMSTAGCLERIKKVEEEKLPFDHYWMDAGWYGAGETVSPDEYEGDWALHTGNWKVNEFRHPDGLLDITGAIKASGKRFILWFEPERVRNNAPLFHEHPEYLLFHADSRRPDALLNLGDPSAWQYCLDTLTELIERLQVSVYRQDFNFHPIEYWRKYDTPERIGISEIKHINGLYRLWDALLAKFPYLLIDNCASGGRRIDVETLRRSIPLWRSDAQCPADPLPELTQAHSLSYSAWMPYSGTGTGRIWHDTYRFRSAYAPAMSTNFTFSERNTFGDDPEKLSWLHKMCKEFLRVRPYLTEDVYPLTTPSDAKDIWSAIQYHDPKTDSGVFLAFRREESPYEMASFRLSAIQPDKTYTFEDADGKCFTVLGSELSTGGLRVEIAQRRDSKLLFYKAEA